MEPEEIKEKLYMKPAQIIGRIKTKGEVGLTIYEYIEENGGGFSKRGVVGGGSNSFGSLVKKGIIEETGLLRGDKNIKPKYRIIYVLKNKETVDTDKEPGPLTELVMKGTQEPLFADIPPVGPLPLRSTKKVTIDLEPLPLDSFCLVQRLHKLVMDEYSLKEIKSELLLLAQDVLKESLKE